MEESGDDEGADDPMSVDVDGDSNTEQSLLDHEDGDVGVGVGVGIGNITEWPSISRQYDLDEMDVSYGLHDARGGEGTPGDGGFDYMDPTEAEIGPFGLATLPALSRRAKARGTPINREVPAAFKIGDADRRGDEDEQSDE